MKCPLVTSHFLEEISSLSHSIVFLYFFALITEEGFLISPCYSLELCIQWVYLSFSPLFFRFSSFHNYLLGLFGEPFCFFARVQGGTKGSGRRTGREPVAESGLTPCWRAEQALGWSSPGQVKLSTDFPGDTVVKNLPAYAGDSGSIPGSGRSAGVGNSNLLQYSCVVNSMNRGAWQATVCYIPPVPQQLFLATGFEPSAHWKFSHHTW